jgi:hypothetical protein
MPHWVTLIHTASGLRVQGNCRLEDSIPNVQAQLMNTLAKLVMTEESSRGKKFQQVQATERETSLQAQLDEMKAMMAQMMGRQNPQTYIQETVAETPKKRGRPKGWKKPQADVPPQAEGAQIIDGPIPQVAFGAVPAPTRPPPEPMKRSRGGVVVKVDESKNGPKLTIHA